MHKLVLIAITSCWLAVPAAAAAQEAAPRQQYNEQWTTKRTDASTGRTFRVDYFDPSDPDGKPPAIERILVRLHPGTRFDTSAVPRCDASDAELMVRGGDACPPGSEIGEDLLVVDTGFPGPARFVTTDSRVFNGEEELIFVAEERESGVRFVVRAAVDENTLDIPLPFVPGTPPDGAAPDEEKGTFFERSTRANGRRTNFLTTPSRCPRSGEWTNRVTYFYRDGVVQTARSTTPCVGSQGRGGGRHDVPPNGGEPHDGGSEPSGRRFPRGGVEAGREQPGNENDGSVLLAGAGMLLVTASGAGLLGLYRRGW